MDDFATLIGMPLDPWERWLVIHAGELRPDGTPRWKRLLIIVARQNGKTTLLKILTLFWMFVQQWPMIVGLSTTVSMAREVWMSAYEYALAHPLLGPELAELKRDNNDPFWRTRGGSKYRPAASTRKGARSLSVDRLITDELREHHDWTAYNASVPTMNARPFAQGFFISNQGDDQSVVLNALRLAGVANIEAVQQGQPEVDEELALFEWSAPPGAAMDDPVALCAANPNANVFGRISLKSLVAQANSIKISGDREAIVKFQTEILCQRVSALDGAINPDTWEAGLEVGELAEHRGRLVLVPELSPDRMHGSLAVCAMLPDGRVRGEVVADFSGMHAAANLKRALPGWVRKIKPRKVGYLPSGPVAAIAAELDQRKLGVEVEPIRSELPAVCMGLAELVDAGDFVHSGQELLTKQALGSAKLWKGDAVWVFSRKGEGYCDALYGVAAAAHLARTIPMPAPIKLVVAKS